MAGRSGRSRGRVGARRIGHHGAHHHHHHGAHYSATRGVRTYGTRSNAVMQVNPSPYAAVVTSQFEAACLGNQIVFESTYPTKLQGLISQDEFARIITIINGAKLSQLLEMVLVLAAFCCAVAAVAYGGLGDAERVNLWADSAGTVKVVVPGVFLLVASLFFGCKTGCQPVSGNVAAVHAAVDDLNQQLAPRNVTCDFVYGFPSNNMYAYWLEFHTPATRATEAAAPQVQIAIVPLGQNDQLMMGMGGGGNGMNMGMNSPSPMGMGMQAQGQVQMSNMQPGTNINAADLLAQNQALLAQNNALLQMMQGQGNQQMAQMQPGMGMATPPMGMPPGGPMLSPAGDMAYQPSVPSAPPPAYHDVDGPEGYNPNVNKPQM